jgi:hypothetical protein
MRSEEWLSITHGRDAIHCPVIRSPNGKYGVASQYAKKGETGDFFLLNGDSVIYHREVDDPRSTDVANDGTTACVDWIEYGEPTGCILTVRSQDESVRFRYETDESAGLTAIDPAGKYVALSTYDGKTRVFDIETGELETLNHNKFADRECPEFKKKGNTLELRFAQSSDSKPLYAIELDGDVLWTDEQLSRREYFETISLDRRSNWGTAIEELAQSYEEADEGIQEIIVETIYEARLVDINSADRLQQIATILAAHIDDFEEGYHQQCVSCKLAETAYRRAKKLYSADGATAEFWNALMRAERHYRNVFPLYDAKDGFAKVRRQQGRVYKKNGDWDAAKTAFEEIRTLENWADVKLFSDADRRRLDDLEERNASASGLLHGRRLKQSELDG